MLLHLFILFFVYCSGIHLFIHGSDPKNKRNSLDKYLISLESDSDDDDNSDEVSSSSSDSSSFRYNPWYSSTTKPLTLLTRSDKQIPTAVAVQGSLAAIGYTYDTVKLCDLAPLDKRDLPKIIESVPPVNQTIALTFLHDRALCTARNNGTFVITKPPYNHEGATHTFTIQKEANSNRTLYCMREKDNRFFCGLDNDTIQVWGNNDQEDGQGLIPRHPHIKTFSGRNAGHINALEIVDNKIISANYAGTLAYHDIESGKSTVFGEYTRNDVIHCMAQQSSILYTGSSSANIAIWDLRTSQLLVHLLSTRGNAVYALAFLTTGHLAAGLNQGRAAIFDIRGTIQKPVDSVTVEDCDADDTITALAPLYTGGCVIASSCGKVCLWG